MTPIQSPASVKGALPYWGVLCCALFVTASVVCLKKGVDNTQNLLNTLGWLEMPDLSRDGSGREFSVSSSALFFG